MPPGFFSRDGERSTCPPGTYCPFPGTQMPVPCPPGTFNAMTGQARCTPCPVGYLCPGFGRVDPAICPPGFVCSREALASPNTLCPAGFFCPNGTATSDPFRNDTTLRPYPCKPGTFCVMGTAYDRVRAGVPGYAQNCTAGFFCELGSSTPLGSGLCPQGFVCPEGTAVPIPTPRGTSAPILGTIAPANCLPGYYAPTIQTVECFPCPAGTSCENDGAFNVSVCPPGTYRSILETDGTTCVGCPQGSWSKQWDVRDSAQCVRCPPGVVCHTDGMRNPCNYDDFPKLWQNARNGLIASDCIRIKDHYFGRLRPPFHESVINNVTVLTGPFFEADPTGELYANSECFMNVLPHGSIVYQRMQAYYGPTYELQVGKKHQGYGNDTYYGYFNTGSRAIALPVVPQFDPANNCTAGFFLKQDDNNVQWYPGSCEADVICMETGRATAQPCPEGYICEEGTTSLTVAQNPCFGGYVCDWGTTPDDNLQSTASMFATLCPNSYYCMEATGPSTQYRGLCPTNYFCPAGTYDPLLGRVANDALMRKLRTSVADPFDPVLEVKRLPGERSARAVSVHDDHCFKGVDPVLLATSRSYLDSRNRTATVNVARENVALCARDDKWRAVHDVITRGACNCVAQLLIVLEIHRIWQCTRSLAALAVCSHENVLLPNAARLSAPPMHMSWRRQRILLSGTPALDIGVQLPFATSLARTYWRECEATAVTDGGQPLPDGTLQGNCTARGLRGFVASARCPVFCTFAEVKQWVEPWRMRAVKTWATTTFLRSEMI
ncbi:hypothetical protein EON62_01655 [archaeon]|nr:MAG: hypothetical protein EON62_01655 [archaeon]